MSVSKNSWKTQQDGWHRHFFAQYKSNLSILRRKICIDYLVSWCRGYLTVYRNKDWRLEALFVQNLIQQKIRNTCLEKGYWLSTFSSILQNLGLKIERNFRKNYFFELNLISSKNSFKINAVVTQKYWLLAFFDNIVIDFVIVVHRAWIRIHEGPVGWSFYFRMRFILGTDFIQFLVFRVGYSGRSR